MVYYIMGNQESGISKLQIPPSLSRQRIPVAFCPNFLGADNFKFSCRKRIKIERLSFFFFQIKILS